MKLAFRWLGLAVFMAALALLAWWWLRVAGADRRAVDLRAAIVDILLFGAFALHHTLLARRGAKLLVARIAPASLVRSTYVWIASALLAAMCLFWRPVGGVVYHAGGIGAFALAAVQLAGVAIGGLAVRRISVRELAGLAEPRPTDALEHGGPYGLVRHPLYLGWVLIFFATPHMTGDRLLFASISTLYLLIAMPYEEADLEQQFGSRYAEYRRTVRWRLIPYVH